MFTGIIEDLAEIKAIKEKESKINGYHTEIDIRLKRFDKLKVGDSIAINGICLTIAKLHNDIATFQAIDETIKKTNLANMKEGERVNVERSLMANGRLDGHFVLGHIDGIGKIKRIVKSDIGSSIEIEVIDNDLIKYIVKKGSIAIDGISLTIANVEKNSINIALIPHTLENTTLGIKKEEDTVNIEIDILARYILNNYQLISNNK